MPEVNNNENKKKQKVTILVGVVTLLIAVIGATYAYFQISTDTESSNTNITGSTPPKSLVTLTSGTDNLHLNISASDMSVANATKEYYGTDGDEPYVGTEELGTKTIASVELTGGEETTKYSCTAKLTVSKVTEDENADTMIDVLQPGDMILQFKGNIINETLDLSELNLDGNKEYDLSFKVIGNTPKEIKAYIELLNKETPQNYLAGKKLNIDINISEIKCEVYDENAEGFNYMTIDKDSFDDYREKIKNVNFVDNINTSKSTASWDLSDNYRGTKAGSVMAWIEPIKNENDSYNLYIGSRKTIKAISLHGAFCEMSQLEVINFNDKLDTSETNDLSYTFSSTCLRDTVDMKLREINGIENWDTSNIGSLDSTFFGLKEIQELNVSNWKTSIVYTLADTFNGLEKLQELDVSKWDTSNVGSFSYTFKGDSMLERLDLSNWNFHNATSTVATFSDCTNLKFIDLRGSLSIPTLGSMRLEQQMFLQVPREAILVVNNEDIKSAFKKAPFVMFYGTIMTVEEYEQQGV